MKSRDKLIEKMIFICALISVASLALITIFLVFSGLKPFLFGGEEAPTIIEFLFGMEWNPAEDIYGIGYMILGTLYATIGAILIAVPISILAAATIAEILPKKAAQISISLVELLAGIPSVIYGIFGLGFLVPLIAEISPQVQGQSLLAVMLVLAIMILPTVISITISSLRAVPQSYREASLGLGANEIQTLFKVTIPSAKRGIFSGVILGIGRAIGETMAIILVAGNVSGGAPSSIWDQVRPMTANIALEMSYAQGLHRDMLFATGLVLFVFVIMLNIILYKIANSKKGV